MMKDKQTDHWIDELVGSLCDPIIVMPGGWGADLPDWLKSQIHLERLMENMKFHHGEPITGTDAECVAYLMTAALEAPLDHEWVDIYLYLSAKVIKLGRPDTDFPDDMQIPEKLTYGQEQELNHFRLWLYEARVKARKGKEKEEKQEIKKQRKEHPEWTRDEPEKKKEPRVVPVAPPPQVKMF